jgi:hypothetical protein
MSIPLIATMVLNGPDILKNHFLSVDYPVNRYFVLDNSMGKCPELQRLFAWMQEHRPKHIKEIVIVTNHLNAGFSGSVNQIIRQNTDCPYWCVFSSDWHPKPGELERLANRLKDPFLGILCDKTQNGYSSLVIAPELIYEVGLLDENFFPAYYEDNDHRYRMKLAGIEWEYFPLEFNHVISATLKSSQVFQEKNKFTFSENLKYYVEKWGGSPGKEKYTTPFDMDLPIDYWLYDPVRSQRQRWI